MNQTLPSYEKIFDDKSPYSNILIGYNYEYELEKDYFLQNNFSYYKIKDINNFLSEIREINIDTILNNKSDIRYLLIDTIDSFVRDKHYNNISRSNIIYRTIENYTVIKKIKSIKYKTIITTPVYRKLDSSLEESVSFNNRLLYMSDFAMIVTNKIIILKDRYNYL